jgi:lactoylglutathione lyase
MTGKPVHSMIRVLDETRATEFYRRAFGLELADRIEFDDFTLIYLRNATSPFELELTVNKGRTEPYSLGDGYGHFAVVVNDLDGEDARMEAAQLKPGPLHELKHGGARIARFFFIKDPDGYSTEVIERGGRFR